MISLLRQHCWRRPAERFLDLRRQAVSGYSGGIPAGIGSPGREGRKTAVLADRAVSRRIITSGPVQRFKESFAAGCAGADCHRGGLVRLHQR